MTMTAFLCRLHCFAREERGAGTAFGVLFTVVLLMISGLAVDVANGWRVQNRIQIAADAAALAAAAKIDKPDEARALALTVAQKNLGTDEAGAITSGDVVFGNWVSASKTFVPNAVPTNAVRVSANKSAARGNALPTYLLQLAGFDSFDVAAGSVAVVNRKGGDTTVAPGCQNATFLTSDSMNIGGGNTVTGPVCFHGELGVHTGGGDYWGPEVRISAKNKATVTINSVKRGSATPEQIIVERSMQPSILPQLNSMFSTMWAAIYTQFLLPGVVTTDLKVDGIYTGNLLPDFIKNPATGKADIVIVNKGWWTVQKGELKPYTIYVVNHGMQIAGGVEASNIAIIAKGQIGIGGGNGLNFQKVFFFAEGQMNMAGNILWGNPTTYCNDKKFGVYLFSKERLSLGGNGNGAGAYGMVGVAPDYNLGGGWTASGALYFEASKYTVLGGGMTIAGCGSMLESAYTVTKPPTPVVPTKSGSWLVN